MFQTPANKFRRSAVLSSAVLGIFVLAACAQNPSDSTTALESVASNSASSLAISSPAVSVGAGASVQFGASGGMPPYNFLLSGTSNSTINSSTGSFTAGSVAESVQILVQDSLGAIAITSIQVLTSTSTSLVDVYRSYSSVTGEHLYSLNASEGPSAGFVNEGAVFSVYPTQVGSTIPLYRCRNPSTGQHSLSASTGCDGQGLVEFTMGYIASTPNGSETSPLYRFFIQETSYTLFFETTSFTEGSGAGYAYNSLLGYAAPAF